MDQLTIYPKSSDIDPSIRLLAKRSHLQRTGGSRGGSRAVSHSAKRFHFVPIYPQLTLDQPVSLEAETVTEEESADSYDISSTDTAENRKFSRTLRLNTMENVDFFMKPQGWDSMVGNQWYMGGKESNSKKGMKY